MEAPRTRVTLLGVAIDNLTMAETIVEIENMIKGDSFSYVVTPNVDHIVNLQKDHSFRQVYEVAALAVPDGVPLLWASQLLGTPLKERVNGTDLFQRVCEMAAAKGYTVFLLGGNPGTAEKASHRLKGSYPSLKIGGCYCPEYGFEADVTECRRIQETVASSGSDILFVGLGAPKQEKWIAQFGAGCKVRVAIGVGVSFSFVSGEIERAPVWMQKKGLEWLWRLIKEPGRLSKRYLVHDLPFLYLVARNYIKAKIPLATPEGRK